MILIPSLVFLSGGSAIGMAILISSLIITFKNSEDHMLVKECETNVKETALTVVVPAYNEESNIEACLTSILKSSDPCEDWKVLLIDDCSTDQTLALAKHLQKKDCISKDRLEIITSGPRPDGERWVGKNWACYSAMVHIRSPWVLFIDADVRLEYATLKRSLNQAIKDNADLLSLAPRLNCQCLAEWMVQPIMASLLGLGFPIKEVNNTKNSISFAAGPFMLFRRSSYESIGGHRDLAGVVVEDLALARKIKSSGFKLRYLLGLDALSLGMYQNFSCLWEGWSKNWFIGLEKSVLKAAGSALIVFWLFSIPWIILIFSTILSLILTDSLIYFVPIICLSAIGVGLQFLLRIWTFRKFKLPLDYWWLMSAGGLIILLLGPTSIWRTLTGKGWTWKGRSLAQI